MTPKVLRVSASEWIIMPFISMKKLCIYVCMGTGRHQSLSGHITTAMPWDQTSQGSVKFAVGYTAPDYRAGQKI